MEPWMIRLGITSVQPKSNNSAIADVDDESARSLDHRIATGPRRGEKVMTIQSVLAVSTRARNTMAWCRSRRGRPQRAAKGRESESRSHVILTPRSRLAYTY